ncbi:hypothetical protein GYMLUDRAFT_243989 [Collybiopsis luxurians FD-317 M1]|uniref:Uncharacterized protein n=1 Tax=Collybiopsis luxurians FD-317 M1 TaxID=944289 RepID=A0A0D0BAT0_9AGAR|nr:hypothetical protein GYMLUDRAFT_243989 [Collybiopsis luxurians FD-317 M1]
MPARDEQSNYENTQNFLKTCSRLGDKKADIGAQCLELNESRRLCEAGMPWRVNEDYVRYHDLATLPICAAVIAHFCLAADLESGSASFHDIVLRVNFDKDELQQALDSVLKLLKGLDDNPSNVKDKADLNAEAKQLSKQLNQIVQIVCDITIDEKAIEMLFPYASRSLAAYRLP